jgi:hypothetical protein
MADRKWDAYYINLDKSTDRKIHMESEFKDSIFNLHRFSAVSDPQNRGWVGVGKSYGEIVKTYREKQKDPNFKDLLIVFEDDAFRTEDIKTFNSRCRKILEYLENHKDTYSHFQGGGIYPRMEKVETEDPLLIRCDWITCATFTVIGEKAMATIEEYQKVPDDKKEPIDNYLASHNRGNMLIPFPHLCWQLLGIPSTISSTEQKVTLNEGFRNAHKDMIAFLKEKNVNISYNIMTGGNRSKSLSFIKKVLKKQKRYEKTISFLPVNANRKTRNVKPSLKTRRSYRISKAM